jgi:hypothetical protein
MNLDGSAFGSFERRLSYTHKPIYSQTLIVLGVQRPHVLNDRQVDKAVRELPIKRGRTEVSALSKLAALVPSVGPLRTLKI